MTSHELVPGGAAIPVTEVRGTGRGRKWAWLDGMSAFRVRAGRGRGRGRLRVRPRGRGRCAGAGAHQVLLLEVLSTREGALVLAEVRPEQIQGRCGGGGGEVEGGAPTRIFFDYVFRLLFFEARARRSKQFMSNFLLCLAQNRMDSGPLH